MATANKTSFDKLSVIRALDQLLWPMALLFARLLAKIPRKQLDQRVIIRPGGMGDLICAQIALETMGLSPKEFIWIVEPRSIPWVKMMNLDHHLIGLSLLTKVAKYRNVINSEQHYGASQIIAIALAGRSRDVTVFSTVRGASTSTNICQYSPTRTHEIDSFVDLFSSANLSSQKEFDLASRTQSKRGESLVVALGGGHADSRSLDIQQWSEIILKWTAGSPFSLIAGPVETSLALQLQRQFADRCTFVPGDFNSNCEKISAASRVLTMDGGLTHVATYFGTPTDAIFTSGQDLLWSPRAVTSRSFYDPTVKCRPCTMFGHTPRCPVDFACKKNLLANVQPFNS